MSVTTATVYFGSVLALSLGVTGAPPVQWLGAVAVTMTGLYMVMATQETPARRSMLCVWVSKEVVWAVYFLWVGAHSALVGCFLFASYPVLVKVIRMCTAKKRGNQNVREVTH